MKNNMFHVKLIEEISNKIPQRNKMVNILTELLCIEKEAVYRRLRGEVPFSFNEVAIIAKKLSVSIDELVDLTSENVSHFKLRQMEFDNPQGKDFSWVEQLVKFVSFIDNPESEACESTNILPKGIYFSYESLTRFYLFKWKYQFEENNQFSKYRDVTLPAEAKVFCSEYVKAAHKIGRTRYILDYRLFEYLANDLFYFRNIHMITEEEVAQIKTDLIDLLNDFERLTLTGRFPDTNNRILVYISNLNFDTNYSYLKTTTYHISFIKAFILNMGVCFDQKTFRRISGWMQSQIKSSTLISESGEMDRIRFFERQREIIEGI